MAEYNVPSNKPRKIRRSSRYLREMVHWAVIAFCLIMFLSLFGLCGFIGGLLNTLVFGLFGLPAFIFPLVFYFQIRLRLEYHQPSYRLRMIGGLVLLMIVLSGLSELIFAGDNPATLLQAFTSAKSDHMCGGFFGLFAFRLFSDFFGRIGAGVILFLLLIICMILLTKKSLFSLLEYGSTKAVSAAKNKGQQLSRNHRQKKSSEKNSKSDSKREAKTVRKGVDLSATDLLHQDEDLAGSSRRSGSRRNSADFNVADESAESPILSSPFETESGQMKFHITRSEEPAEATDSDGPSDEMAVKTRRKRKTTAKADPLTEQEQAAFNNQIDAEQSAQQESEENYQFPPMELLAKSTKSGNGSADRDKVLYETAQKLENTLNSFGVKVTVTNASCGPTVTRYELQPEQGVKVSRIVSLADDIKLNLAVTDIRIEAPIPGKSAVGIEVPNPTNSAVLLGDLLSSQQFKNSSSRLSFAVGKDIAGQPVIADIARMPHLLIAGATGSGKSVCINTLIMSILYKARPDEVKLIMIDPKVVELSVYNGIPHLLIPVVTDPKKAAAALNWAVSEMTERYNKFAQFGVRDMKGYNSKIDTMDEEDEQEKPQKMPQIVVIVDELADLMMVASKEVEDYICRLAQLARAAGIHLIIATQRPSVNVITGLIKANMPSRVAFAVSSGVDSRTILDMNGAEKLLGKGDMLFYPQGYPKPARLQGSFVSDKEVADIVAFLTKGKETAAYDDSVSEKISRSAVQATDINSNSDPDRDVLFEDAGRFIIEKERASIGMLQRMFKIGFNRAARIMDQLCEAGVVSGEEGTKPRKILMTAEEFESSLKNSRDF